MRFSFLYAIHSGCGRLLSGAQGLRNLEGHSVGHYDAGRSTVP